MTKRVGQPFIVKNERDKIINDILIKKEIEYLNWIDENGLNKSTLWTWRTCKIKHLSISNTVKLSKALEMNIEDFIKMEERTYEK